MLIVSSGANTRHFFFQPPRLFAGLVSASLNCVLFAFLWSQSFSNLDRSAMSRNRVVEIYLKGATSQAARMPTVSHAVAGTPATTEKPPAVGPSSAETGSNNNPLSTEPPAQSTEPNAELVSRTVPPTDSASLAIPNQLDFPFQLRRRGLFEPPAGARSSAPAIGGGSSGEQQSHRQRMQSEMHRNMIYRLLGDLNEAAKPDEYVMCQLHPKVSCDRHHLPSLEIVRRYEGFFSQVDIKENFVLVYKNGSWSIEQKRPD